MGRPFILYEKALKPQSFPRMFDDTARAGYSGFEMSIDESDRRLERLLWDGGKRREVRQQAEHAGVRIQSLCFSAQRKYAMGSADPAIAQRSMELMERCIHLCSDMGIRTLQVAGYDVFYEDETPETMKRYVENLHRSTIWAEQLGVLLAIEPVENGVIDVAGALEIVDQIASPFLAVYPDNANMISLGIDPVPQFLLGKGRFPQMHIRDGRFGVYTGIPMGEGEADFLALFKAIDQIDYHGPITIEMWYQDGMDHRKAILHAREYLEQYIKLAKKETV